MPQHCQTRALRRERSKQAETLKILGVRKRLRKVKGNEMVGPENKVTVQTDIFFFSGGLNGNNFTGENVETRLKKKK